MVEGLDGLVGCANCYSALFSDVILSVCEGSPECKGGSLGFPLWGNANTTFKS
jgi:hypothetical protein